MNDTQQLCTFYLGDLFFGVEVLEVQEILRYHRMTRVPMSPPAITGLINLRGQIVTALELRTMLNLPPRTGTGEPMNLVVRSSGDTLSFLVDAIGDVVQVDSRTFETPPSTMPASLRPYITGVHKLDGKLLLVLDLDRLLTKGLAA